MPVAPATLYHYTCVDHGEPGIRSKGKLLPNLQPLLGRSLVWLTDLDTPDAWALGLTQHTLCCDRTEIRVTAKPFHGTDKTAVVPWWHYARNVEPVLREVLETKGLPMHWWVSPQPVTAIETMPMTVVWDLKRGGRAHA